MKFILNFISGTLLTGVVYFLGGLDLALETLLVIIVIDYLTGVLKAIHNKKLDSKIGARGIIKKIGYLCIVALAFLLDRIIGDSGMIRNVTIYFFVANEGISILENWAGLGLKTPNVLLDVLNQIKNKNKGEDK